MFIPCWKNTTAIKTSDKQAGERKDVFVAGKELGLLEMYPLDYVEVSWQTTLGNSVMALCIVCPYRSTRLYQQSLPRATTMEGDTGPSPCNKLISSVRSSPQLCKSWQTVLLLGWQCPSFRSLPVGPVIRGLGQTWGFKCGSSSHSSQRSQWPFRTFVPQFPIHNPWITALAFLTT